MAVRGSWDQRGHDRRRWRAGALPNSAIASQKFAAVAQRRYAHLFQILIGQLAQDDEIDIVGAEHLGILGETDPAEPTVDVQVQSPGLLSAAVFEEG